MLDDKNTKSHERKKGESVNYVKKEDHDGATTYNKRNLTEFVQFPIHELLILEIR